MTTKLEDFLPKRTFTKGQGKTKRCMVSVPEDVHADLHTLAESMDTSMSSVVVALLDRYLGEQDGETGE